MTNDQIINYIFWWGASIIGALITLYISTRNNSVTCKIFRGISYGYLWLNMFAFKLLWWLIFWTTIGIIGGLVFNIWRNGPNILPTVKKPYQDIGAPKLDGF